MSLPDLNFLSESLALHDIYSHTLTLYYVMRGRAALYDSWNGTRDDDYQWEVLCHELWCVVIYIGLHTEEPVPFTPAWGDDKDIPQHIRYPNRLGVFLRELVKVVRRIPGDCDLNGDLGWDRIRRILIPLLRHYMVNLVPDLAGNVPSATSRN